MLNHFNFRRYRYRHFVQIGSECLNSFNLNIYNSATDLEEETQYCDSILVLKSLADIRVFVVVMDDM